MDHAAALLSFLAVAEQEIGAGAFFQHKGKIFTSCGGMDFIQHRVGAKHLHRQRTGIRGFFIAVNQHRVGVVHFHIARRAIAFGGELRDILNALNKQIAHVRLHGAHGKLHDRAFRDDVGGDAGLEGADGDDGRLARRDVARDDTLQRHDDGRAGDYRVCRAVRVRAVAAVTVHGEFHRIRRGHKVAGIEAEFTDRQPWHIVQAEYAVAREALEQTVFDHEIRSANGLFRRLEDKVHGAVKLTGRRRDVFGGSQQNSCVTVVAAGVHFARRGAGPRQVGGFENRQGVHIRAQADGFAACAFAERPDYAGFAKTASDLIAPLFKLTGNQFACVKLFQT